MSFKLSLGRAAITQVPVYTNEAIAAFYPKRAVADTRFLYYLLPTLALLEAADVAVKGMTLNKAKLQGLTLVLPPLPEQRKIAVILSSMDDAIEKTQAVIDQIQVVKKGLMQELLTRGVPGRHKKFQKTEIGEIPEGWHVVPLEAACQRMFVGIAQAATHAYAEDGVPLVRTTNVRPNRLDERLLHITPKFAEQMRGKTLRAGDVLTARTGYPGTSAVVPSELDGAQCFTLLVSRPGPLLRSRFLVHVMNSSLGERIVARGQAGGAQQNLNVTVFKGAKVALPPVDEQDAICDLLDSCYARELAEERQRASLGHLKQAVMAVLLTGEVRVKPDPEAA